MGQLGRRRLHPSAGAGRELWRRPPPLSQARSSRAPAGGLHPGAASQGEQATAPIDSDANMPRELTELQTHDLPAPAWPNGPPLNETLTYLRRRSVARLHAVATSRCGASFSHSLLARRDVHFSDAPRPGGGSLLGGTSWSGNRLPTARRSVAHGRRRGAPHASRDCTLMPRECGGGRGATQCGNALRHGSRRRAGGTV